MREGARRSLNGKRWSCHNCDQTPEARQTIMSVPPTWRPHPAHRRRSRYTAPQRENPDGIEYHLLLQLHTARAYKEVRESLVDRERWRHPASATAITAWKRRCLRGRVQVDVRAASFHELESFELRTEP